MLTFSRKEISQPVPVEPNKAIRELATLLQRIIGEDIEMVLDLEATGAIVIDKTHFEQVILNIVVNARDAMPSGGQVTISTRDSARPSAPSGDGAAASYVDIQIRDTGIGMDEATRLRAFEPFFTTKEVGRGTGLGLATVYGIVQQRGGEISIESRLNEGTQISISLPATTRENAMESNGSAKHLLPGSGHILLVEDEVELRNTNAEFLTSIGYTVTCAANGPEALQVLEQLDRVDLVISDVVMPKMSGPEFASRLLQLRPTAKLLFVSGYADEIILKTGLSRSGTPFLQKPYSLHVLRAKIQEVLTADARETADDTTLANGD